MPSARVTIVNVENAQCVRSVRTASRTSFERLDIIASVKVQHHGSPPRDYISRRTRSDTPPPEDQRGAQSCGWLRIPDRRHESPVPCRGCTSTPFPARTYVCRGALPSAVTARLWDGNFRNRDTLANGDRGTTSKPRSQRCPSVAHRAAIHGADMTRAPGRLWRGAVSDPAPLGVTDLAYQPKRVSAE